MCSIDCCTLYCCIISGVGTIFLIILLIMVEANTVFFGIKWKTDNDRENTAMSIWVSTIVYGAFVILCCVVMFMRRGTQEDNTKKYLENRRKNKNYSSSNLHPHVELNDKSGAIRNDINLN